MARKGALARKQSEKAVKKIEKKKAEKGNGDEGETDYVETPGDYEDDENYSEEEEDSSSDDEKVTAYRPGMYPLEEDEELVMDASAYDMYHQFTTEWPCLSFDVLTPNGFTPRLLGPQEMFLVGGTQAAKGYKNALTIFRLQNLRRTWEPASDEESDDAESDVENEEANQVKMQTSTIQCDYAFNKVAVCPMLNNFVATWTEDGALGVYDISTHVERLVNSFNTADPLMKPVALFKQETEGFAVDWCQQDAVSFVSGNRKGQICIFDPVKGGWTMSGVRQWASAVESISMKFNDTSVFAAGTCDGSVSIWDTRSDKVTMTLEKVHDGDVNVVKFGSNVNNADQLLSGGDDGKIRLVDLRFPSECLYENSYHRGAICSLDWSKSDYTTFIAGSYDNTCSIWDLSAEGTDEGVQGDGNIEDDVPKNLIFEHCGHQDLTFAKFHPLIPYMAISTGQDSFNIWRPEDLFKFAKAAYV